MTVCAAKKSRSTRLRVISQVTCLIPFSQMSRCRPFVSSGHAQPGQSKPPFSWFIREIARGPSTGSRARASTLRDAARGAPAGGGMVVVAPAELARRPTGPRPSAGTPGTAPSIRSESLNR